MRDTTQLSELYYILSEYLLRPSPPLDGIRGAIRGLGWVNSLLEGPNVAAVGPVYGAAYRPGQIGH